MLGAFIEWRASLKWTVILVAVSHIIFSSEGFVLLLRVVKIAARLTYGMHSHHLLAQVLGLSYHVAVV